LETLHHVEELLDLGLQLDNLLGSGARRDGHGSKNQGDGRAGEEAVTKGGNS
jgi:hypothetical protein